MVALRKKISRMALALTCYYIINFSYKYAHATTASGASRTLAGNGNVNHRLPRTSASYFSSGASGITNFKSATKSKNLTRYGNIHIREQQLLNIFEVIIDNFEGKLKRIDSLDNKVDLLMKNMETLQSRVVNNLVKTDFIITQLKNIEKSVSCGISQGQSSYLDVVYETTKISQNSSTFLKEKIVNLDRKVSDIDNKLECIKAQLDNNLLHVEDFNAEASEKKPVSINVNDITKALSYEAMTHVTSELSELRDSTDSIDKKLQFYINIVSENIGRMTSIMHEIHFAVVDHNNQLTFLNVTTGAPATKSKKLHMLDKEIEPMGVVSEKMDNIWGVVVDSKSTEDHLPKSSAPLTQTQRQERAIDEIRQDHKSKSYLNTNNLDMVQQQLRKLETYMPPEEITDTTKILEYESKNYSDTDENLRTENLLLSLSYIQPTIVNKTVTTFFTSTPGDVLEPPHSASLDTTHYNRPVVNGSKSAIRKDRIIFPSIKKKPAFLNTTIANDFWTLKDVKGFSCVDILNAGMKQSGVFYLQIRGTTYWFLKVYCDQETTDGGWTVIQRRDDFKDSRENFNRDWADYKNGFGEPSKDFWLGNENIYMLTNNEEYSLRVELEDFEGNKRYAQYSHFKIHSEADYYKLEIDGYEGNAGDSLNDPWYGSNNSPFSTYNKDNDRSSLNCASMLKSGWWWKSCGRGLNGLYLHDPQDLTARQGIVWFRWRGWDYTLKKAKMMIRPKTPPQQTISGTSL
ncbi:angiopoietin-1 isoform X1 [Drosophila erecta]|uniref:angiopoietin-1 isoform X1 n=3 Tax=Drosophila erecta TaxID=7220 RepID=UPI000F05A0F6|nr:angiopoietin-1 isoform X1 [Drosophila erecta]